MFTVSGNRMNGLDALSRLDPGACDFTPRVDGGWISEVTMENLAGALGMMTTDQACLVRVIVLNDPRAMRHVISRVRGMLISSSLSIDEQIKLAQVVVSSIVMPSLCKTCDGHAQYMRGALVITCPDCGGTGHRNISGKEHAANAGIKQWRRHTDDYDRCRDVLLSWMSEAGRIWFREMSE
jgi:predicted RNA-binding Zn-ribbon protein involved in translation (DUF1610 family)